MGVSEREEAPDTFEIFVSFKVQSAGWEDLPSHPKSLYNILRKEKSQFLRRNRKYAGKESFYPAVGDKNAEKYFCAAKLHFPPHECCIAEDRIRRTDIPEGDGNEYGDSAKEVLKTLLEMHMSTGIYKIEGTRILKLDILEKFSAPIKNVTMSGEKVGCLQVKDPEEELYKAA